MNIKEIINNARAAALRDGDDQCILRRYDGELSFSRKCFDLLKEQRTAALFRQTVIGIVKTYWENGMLNVKYQAL